MFIFVICLYFDNEVMVRYLCVWGYLVLFVFVFKFEFVGFCDEGEMFYGVVFVILVNVIWVVGEQLCDFGLLELLLFVVGEYIVFVVCDVGFGYVIVVGGDVVVLCEMVMQGVCDKVICKKSVLLYFVGVDLLCDFGGEFVVDGFIVVMWMVYCMMLVKYLLCEVCEGFVIYGVDVVLYYFKCSVCVFFEVVWDEGVEILVLVIL